MPSSIPSNFPSEPLDILVEYGYLDDDTPYHIALSAAVNDFSMDSSLGGDLNRDYIEILQNEAKKELKLRRRKINVSKLFGRGEKKTTANTTGTGSLAVRKQTIDPAKLVSTPAPEKTQESLAIVVRGIDSIVETLKAEKKQDTKHFSFLRKMVERFKRRRDENKLEFQIFDGLKKTATKLLTPFKSAWSQFLEFIGKVLLGRVLFKILEWMGNEENQGKLQSIIKFFKDWWPVMLGGYLLFGNALTSMVTGLLIKMAMWVPKMLLAIGRLMMNPYVAAAVLLGGGAILAQQQIKKNRQAFDEQDDDSTLTVEEFQEDNQGITNPNEKTADIQPSQGYVETGSMPGMMNFNKGGTVPGSGNTDTVPAMLTPGEFVMSKGAVQKYGANTLEGLNAAAGGTNKPTLMGGYGVSYISPQEAKERLAARGMPSMELMDGTVVPNFGKMGVDSFNQGIQMIREGMANNPEKIQELDNFLETNPYAQPDELQRVINVVVPGSQAQVMSNLGDSITASARMNGGGLVQAFQGGGQVRRVQMGRGAAKRRMEASKITPIKKKKVTVAYAEEKQNMADKPNMGKSGQEIPSFNVTAMRSPEKIKVLGISV